MQRQEGQSIRWWIWAALLLVSAGPALAGLQRVAAVELHNASGESLPRIDEYSEKALTSLLGEAPELAVIPSAELARALIEQRIPVVRVPGDAAVAAGLGQALNATYLVSGKILAFRQEMDRQSLEVELVIFDVAAGSYPLRRRYIAERAASGAVKVHRELLDDLLVQARRDLLAVLTPGASSSPQPAPARPTTRPAEDVTALPAPSRIPAAVDGGESAAPVPMVVTPQAFRPPPGPTFEEQAAALRRAQGNRPATPRPRRPAAELLAEAEQLTRAGLPGRARALFVDALVAARTTGDALAEAAAHDGLCRVRRGPQGRLAHCWSALEIRQRSGDKTAEVATRMHLGEVFSELGLVAEAVQELEQAAELARSAGDRTLGAEVKEALGQALVHQGQVEAGKARLTEALGFWREKGEPLSEAGIHLRLAGIDSDLGRLAAAVAHVEEALAIYQKAGSAISLDRLLAEIESSGAKATFDVWAMQNPAPVMYDPGGDEQYEELVEERYAQRMGEIRNNPSSTPWELEDRDGSLRREVEDEVEEELRQRHLPYGPYGQTQLPLDDAFMERLARAWEMSRRVGGRKYYALLTGASDRQSLAVLEAQEERMAAVLSRIETLSPLGALSTRNRQDVCLRFQLSEIQSSLSHLYEVLREPEHAAVARAAAWRAWEESSGALLKSSSHASAEANKHSMEALLKRYGASAGSMPMSSPVVSFEDLLQVDKLRRAGLSPPSSVANALCGLPAGRARDQWLRAEAERLTGDPRKALGTYMEVLSSQTDPGLQTAALAGLARSHAALGETGPALDVYRQALEGVESLLGDLSRQPIEFASLHAPLYSETIRLLAGQGDTGAAFAVAERARAYDFHRRLAGVLPAARGFSTADVLALRSLEQQARELREVSSWDDRFRALFPPAPDDDIPPDPNEKVLAEVERERDALRERLETARAEAGSDLGFATVSLDDLRREVLPPATTLVSYFVTETETLAWIVDRDAARLERLPVERNKLAEKIEFLRIWIGRRGFDRDTASWLYERLLAPLAPHIRNRDLVVVPHGPLHYLPFAALWDGKGGRFAAEVWDLSSAPSATALRLAAKRKLSGGELLILGPPDSSLPAATDEARAVAGLLGGVPLLGSQASRQALQDQLKTAGLLHVAAHGVYDPQDPLASYLQLAPAGPEGRLTAGDILALDLSATGLAVLSACDTAAGRVSDGDDVVGLTRAFLAAGAPSVITTLWSIDDEASEALVTSFYRHLRAPGTSLAAALRAAQHEVAREESWSSPYYWAGFVLFGDRRAWQPIPKGE